MKLMKCTRLLLQSTFTMSKLSNGCGGKSILLEQARLLTISHPAIRNLIGPSSHCCSCVSIHTSTRPVFLNYNWPLSTQFHHKNIIATQSDSTQRSTQLLRTGLSNNGPCMHFWSRSKSKEVKDAAKPEEDIPEDKMSLYQRFKHMYKNYWYVLIPVHVVTSIGWGGLFYYIASSGLDIPAFLETIGASQKIIDMMKNSATGYVAITYTMYKIATPLRYSVTLGGTTMAIKHLVQQGLIKPVDRHKIKQMYTETKDQFNEKRAQLIEKKDSLRDSVMEKRSQVLSHMADCKKELAKSSQKKDK